MEKLKKILFISLAILLLVQPSVVFAKEGVTFKDSKTNLNSQGLDFSVEVGGFTGEQKVDFYQGTYKEPLNVRYLLFENVLMDQDPVEVTKEELLNTEKMPVIEYTYEVGEDNFFNFTFNGKTLEGEKLALSVYNPNTGSFYELDSQIDRGDGLKLNANTKVLDYAQDGKIVFRIYPKLVSNGSNSIFWITDTQYYTMSIHKEKGIYDMMTALGAEKYKNGEIGYAIHTGDITDSPDLLTQNLVADRAQKNFDMAGLPNGILAGNHDVGYYEGTVNYNRMFSKYFGKHRYERNDWYGEESKENNSLNYQLVTLGDTDYIFLLIGFGIERDPETISWANDILQKYSHRTAVVATHAYLGYEGEYLNERVETLVNQVIKPNTNLRLKINIIFFIFH